MEYWFHQLSILPFTYLIILMLVVSSNVLAKLLGPILIAKTSGSIHHYLSKPIRITTTGDRISIYLFDRGALLRLGIQLVLSLKKGLPSTVITDQENISQDNGLLLSKILIPEKFWSGTPPNLGWA